MLFAPFHAESGRSDALNTINDFVLTPNSTSAFENFTIVDDDVLEFDEIFTAEFSFSPEIANNWSASEGDPRKVFIRIRDDDCELCYRMGLNCRGTKLSGIADSHYIRGFYFCG